MIDEDDNLLIESEFFWHALIEGDKIVLEADYFEEGALALRQGKAYEVLAKTQPFLSNMSFVVQSDITDQLVNVHPFLVDNYLINPVKYRLN
ncbi:hypothetical protein [Neptunomonas antarctica]|uniref:Uncharacterized protein n=1 Tax=Neptunomonas antarctica TaxID=619304 RepID=A0A1N7LK80_9GAMM|nr:hypothetical protein [Neptunomonas antarctica]SIS74212.1 hypothetical protein SAMN05421760_10497 [Neptunomonas antarctica]